MSNNKKNLKSENICNSYKNNGGSAGTGTEQEAVDLKAIKEILDENVITNTGKDTGKDNSSLMVILQKAQEEYGYIPREVINAINKRTGIATSNIYGIVTFYDQFTTEKRGKYTIKTCSGTACQVKGGKKSLAAVKKRLGIDVGETTADYQFSVETAGCLGACAIAPAMLVNKQLFGRSVEKRIDPIINEFSEK